MSLQRRPQTYLSGLVRGAVEKRDGSALNHAIKWAAARRDGQPAMLLLVEQLVEKRWLEGISIFTVIVDQDERMGRRSLFLLESTANGSMTPRQISDQLQLRAAELIDRLVPKLKPVDLCRLLLNVYCQQALAKVRDVYRAQDATSTVSAMLSDRVWRLSNREGFDVRVPEDLDNSEACMADVVTSDYWREMTSNSERRSWWDTGYTDYRGVWSASSRLSGNSQEAQFEADMEQSYRTRYEPSDDDSWWLSSPP